MKAPRRSYTPEEKAEALKLYQEIGPTEAGKRLGIDKSLITKWAKKNGVSTVATEKMIEARKASEAKYREKREALKTVLLDRVYDLNGRMDNSAAAQHCRDYCTSIGILVDKCNILDGKHTESLELNINGEDPRGKLAHLVDRIATRRAENKDNGGAE